MTLVARFPAALGGWISQHLAGGAEPHALVQTMQERDMTPDVAHAIVDAFVRARREGRAPPVDAVDLPAPPADARRAPGYRSTVARLPAGPVIETADRRVRVVARAAQPALALLAGVLDAAECEELIARARGRLLPSTTVDLQTGHDVVSGARTSFGMFFRPLESPFIARLERRLAQVMNLPVGHSEGLQVLHYPQGAGSAPHFDFLQASSPANRASLARSGQRVSTLVAYLNDVPAGGETVFPALGWAVSPQRGHAVCFEYANGFGEVDPASLHASQAVLHGEKWAATLWMRERPFVPAGTPP